MLLNNINVGKRRDTIKSNIYILENHGFSEFVEKVPRNFHGNWMSDEMSIAEAIALMLLNDLQHPFSDTYQKEAYALLNKTKYGFDL